MAREKPGIGFLVGVDAFGGGKLQCAVTIDQLERVTAPVAAHVKPSQAPCHAFSLC
ncbi:hypothetical protein BZL30_1929 [Mycobacterium kansasii]|uniref:Uncharacterized protein n=1 Tax=Mycobacterium kansasii TaxID=1768 RepID=A0A1V3XGP3_MYCKA|nr:hypothetical protein BZL30_1929 [Mycobacterium kansasii]